MTDERWIGEMEWCEEHQQAARIIDVHDEQVGYEEQAQPYRVLDLLCGCEIVLQATR